MKKHLLTALLFAGLAGCAKEPSPAPGTNTPVGVPVSITAAVDATRSALGDDLRTVTWSRGDRIAVYSQIEADGSGHAQAAANDGYQMEFTLNESSAGSASGLFDGTLIPYSGSQNGTAVTEDDYTDPTYTLHTYYPFSEANARKKKDAVLGTLPALQSCDMKGAYDLSSYDFLVGVMKDMKKGDTNIAIPFRRVFALMQFRITNATAESFSVRKVEMAAPGKALAGDFTIKVHRTLNIVADTKPGVDKNDGRPSFDAAVNASNKPSESIAVTVDQGLIPAGGEGNVKAMFNRWEDLKNTDLTITVTTNKGTFTKVLKTGGRDFSLKDNYVLPISVDALTPLGDEPVDNYVEGGMTLINADVAYTSIQPGGTFCIDGDIKVANNKNISIKGNTTIIGRHTLHGVPQDTFRTCFANNNIAAEGTSLVFKDLIVKPLAAGTGNRYIVRFNSSKANVENVTFDNCIIEYPAESTTAELYLLVMQNSGFVAKNLTIKNCIVRNLKTGLITYEGAAAEAQANIGRIELVNNTFYADAQTPSEYFQFCGGNIVMRNNTFYNYTSAANGSLISVAAGTVDCTNNIFHAPAPSVLFDAAPAAAAGNCLFNFSLVGGAETGMTDPLFTAPPADLTPRNPDVIGASQGDQRWL